MLFGTPLALASLLLSVGSLAHASTPKRSVVDLTSPSPAPFQDIAAALTTPVDAPHVWDCDIKAWVRAPDLKPNMLAAGDARLIANGSECGDLVKWEVGLRFKERSIVRLVAPDAVLPIKAKVNETEDMAYWKKRSQGHILHEGILSFGNHHRVIHVDEGLSPRDIIEKAYNDALSNKTLWEVHGAERVVFDTRVELASAAAGIPTLAVQSFGLAVPAVNLPAFQSFDHGRFFVGFDENPEYSNAEKQLSYYFALTLANGTTFEVPAGQTTFLPEPSVDLQATAPRTVKIELERPVPSPRDWEMVSKHDECVDNSTRFEVEIELPQGAESFSQGQQIDLRTTIRRVGSVPEAPSYISFKPSTSSSKTWAASFARSEEQRLRLSGLSVVQHRHWAPFRHHQTQLRSKPALTREERQQRLAEEEKRGTTRSCSYGNGVHERAAGGTQLDNVDIQTVSVNFTIPADFMPSVHGTFVDYLSYIQITLHTTYSCPRQREVEVPLDDLNDDDAWSPYPRHRERTAGLEKSGIIPLILHGNVSITIHPNTSTSSTSPVAHYLQPAALAPRLLRSAPSTLSQVEFLPLQQEVVEETTEDELLAHRYELTGRYNDGAHHQVGMVWALKVRRELDALEDAEAKWEAPDAAAFVTQAQL